MARGKDKRVRAAEKTREEDEDKTPVQKRLKDKLRKREGNSGMGAVPWKYVAIVIVLLAGGFLQVVVPAMEKISELTRTRLHYIDVTTGSNQELEDIFFSGQPWAVACKSPDEKLNPVFNKAATEVGKQGMDLKMGVLDCEAVLPSGMTVSERFELNSTVFTVANGGRPHNVPMGYFQYEQNAVKMAEYLQDRTKMIPLRSIASTKQIQDYCVKKKFCVAVLHYETLKGSDLADMIEDFSFKYRNIRFVTIDVRKYNLAPIQGKLPKPADGVQRYPRILFMKRMPANLDIVGVHTNAKSMTTAVSHQTLDEFLQDMLDSKSTTKLASFSGSQLQIRRASSSSSNSKTNSKPKTDKTKTNTHKKPKITIKDDVQRESKFTKEQNEQRKRELERLEEMEQESLDNYVYEMDEGDYDEWDEENEFDEEIVIDLD